MSQHRSITCYESYFTKKKNSTFDFLEQRISAQCCINMTDLSPRAVSFFGTKLTTTSRTRAELSEEGRPEQIAHSAK